MHALRPPSTPWTLRRPSKVTSSGVAGGSKVETTQYDATTGLMTGHRLTKSPSSDAASTVRYYYYTEDGSSPIAACRNHPEWQWLLCQTGPGAQPGGSLPALPSTTYQYNRLDKVISEARGSRVKSTSYDPIGREVGSSWSSASGTAVPSTTVTYSPTTGREIKEGGDGQRVAADHRAFLRQRRPALAVQGRDRGADGYDLRPVRPSADRQ